MVVREPSAYGGNHRAVGWRRGCGRGVVIVMMIVVVVVVRRRGESITVIVLVVEPIGYA
jgi:hypothetical protein